jgi:Tfp pilus assembly protein FimT
MKSLILKASLKGSESHSTAGFTLIQMVVVVAIVGILGAIAGPSWISYGQNRRASAAQDQLLQAIRLAQSEALRTRQAQTIQLNVAANPPTITVAGQVERLGAGNNPAATIPAGAIGLQSTVTTIRFQSNGSVDSSLNVPHTITVTSPATGAGAARRCVVIDTLLGAVRSATPGQPNCL